MQIYWLQQVSIWQNFNIDINCEGQWDYPSEQIQVFEPATLDHLLLQTSISMRQMNSNTSEFSFDSSPVCQVDNWLMPEHPVTGWKVNLHLTAVLMTCVQDAR